MYLKISITVYPQYTTHQGSMTRRKSGTNVARYTLLSVITRPLVITLSISTSNILPCAELATPAPDNDNWDLSLVINSRTGYEMWTHTAMVSSTNRWNSIFLYRNTTHIVER